MGETWEKDFHLSLLKNLKTVCIDTLISSFGFSASDRGSLVNNLIISRLTTLNFEGLDYFLDCGNAVIGNCP